MHLKYIVLKLKGLIKRKTSLNISNQSFIARGAQLFGLNNIQIGDFSTIGENSTLTVNDRKSSDISLKIGSNCFIGRNSFIAVGQSVEIGDYCIFGNNCSIMCSDHIFETPLIPYRLSGVTTDKKIKVGVNSWFGINVTVIGNLSIGHGSVIGANTVITKDIPPFSMVVGNPSKIIKRFDFAANRWVRDYEPEESIYSNEGIYLEFLRSKFGNIPKAYHSSSSEFGDL